MESARIRKAVTAGLLSAVVLTLGFTGIDFIPLPLGAVTILHVPVIIGAILEGPVVGMFIGLLFGIFSIIKAAMIGVTPVDLAFLNFPIIAIIPRLSIGPVSWALHRLIAGSEPPPERGWTTWRVLRSCAGLICAAIGGTLTNTVLVLSGLVFCVNELGPTLADRAHLALIVALTNGPVEAALSAVITLAVISAWTHIPRHGGRSKLTGGR